MNQIITINQPSVLTMSSREIVELTGKQHFHVIRDIKEMLAEMEIEASKFGGYYIAANGKQNPCFNLPKRETTFLVSGYSVAMRAGLEITERSFASSYIDTPR